MDQKPEEWVKLLPWYEYAALHRPVRLYPFVSERLCTESGHTIDTIKLERISNHWDLSQTPTIASALGHQRNCVIAFDNAHMGRVAGRVVLHTMVGQSRLTDVPRVVPHEGGDDSVIAMVDKKRGGSRTLIHLTRVPLKDGAFAGTPLWSFRPPYNNGLDAAGKEFKRGKTMANQNKKTIDSALQDLAMFVVRFDHTDMKLVDENAISDTIEQCKTPRSIVRFTTNGGVPETVRGLPDCDDLIAFAVVNDGDAAQPITRLAASLPLGMDTCRRIFRRHDPHGPGNERFPTNPATYTNLSLIGITDALYRELIPPGHTTAVIGAAYQPNVFAWALRDKQVVLLARGKADAVDLVRICVLNYAAGTYNEPTSINAYNLLTKSNATAFHNLFIKAETSMLYNRYACFVSTGWFNSTQTAVVVFDCATLKFTAAYWIQGSYGLRPHNTLLYPVQRVGAKFEDVTPDRAVHPIRFWSRTLEVFERCKLKYKLKKVQHSYVEKEII
jgi:hypothetical protein